MGRTIAKFVVECVVCQQVKDTTNKPIELLQPLAVPKEIWEDIAMDFITDLPKVRGHSVIVTVVDLLSKFCHLESLPSSYNVVSVAEFYIQNVVKIHGFPKSIVSDRIKVHK